MSRAPRVIALIATIPPRRVFVEGLLRELTRQTRVPDLVALCLDGYGDAPAPACPLPCIEYRTAERCGPGARWRVARDFAPQDILVCIDDDHAIAAAPKYVERLVAAAEEGDGAAAVIGLTPKGKRAHGGDICRGMLIYAAGCGLTVRAGLLEGLSRFAEDIRDRGGPDALGSLGDDDALVSAYLWQRGVTIRHAAVGGEVHAAIGTQATSLTLEKRTRGEHPGAQKRMIKQLTGWPWPDIV